MVKFFLSQWNQVPYIGTWCGLRELGQAPAITGRFGPYPGEDDAPRQGPDALARALGKQEGGIRPVQEAADALRRFHGVRGHTGVPRHRHQQGAEPAARSVEAHRRPRPFHPALRHGNQMGLLRGGGSACRRAESRKAHVRGNLPRGRGARHDRGLARERQQEARVRVAEGIDVLDSINAWHRIVNATSGGALLLAGTTAPNVLNMLQNVERVFNNPFVFRDRFSAPTTSTRPRTTSSPIPCGASRCGARISSRCGELRSPLDNRRSLGWRRSSRS